jgi:hypothetical protein
MLSLKLREDVREGGVELGVVRLAGRSGTAGCKTAGSGGYRRDGNDRVLGNTG